MIKKFLPSLALAVAFLFSPLAQAANLVNDFSVNVGGGVNWTDPSPMTGITSNFTTSFLATGVPGLVNQGFVTVDYQSAYPMGLFYSYTVDAFNSGSAGYDFSLTGVTGFNVSLRKESNNTASSINFYIIGSNDNVYEWNIDTSSLSTSEFRVIPIALASNSAWASSSPTGAMNIGIAASYNNPASTRYNVSIDSVSSVPEPNAGILLLGGLTALGLTRRRNRS